MPAKKVEYSPVPLDPLWRCTMHPSTTTKLADADLPSPLPHAFFSPDSLLDHLNPTQGGAIAYLTGLTHPSPLAGIIALSSWLPLKSKIVSLLSPHAKDTPVFHGHGSSDQIVQFAFGKRTVEFLKGEAEGGLGMGELKTASGAGGKAKGVKFEIYKGMAHSACPEEVSSSKRSPLAQRGARGVDISFYHPIASYRSNTWDNS